MELSVPFVIDAVAHGDVWCGRVSVDGNVLFLTAGASTQDVAVQEARTSLAAHLRMLFTGAADVEHQQQTERYDSLVELQAAQVLHQAAGWDLDLVRVQDDRLVAVFQRDWPLSGHRP